MDSIHYMISMKCFLNSEQFKIEWKQFWATYSIVENVCDISVIRLNCMQEKVTFAPYWNFSRLIYKQNGNQQNAFFLSKCTRVYAILNIRHCTSCLCHQMVRTNCSQHNFSLQWPRHIQFMLRHYLHFSSRSHPNLFKFSLKKRHGLKLTLQLSRSAI